MKRKADFSNIQDVLLNKNSKRPTLFEFFMNNKVYEYLAGYKGDWSTVLKATKFVTDAFYNGGYDYACFCGGSLEFYTTTAGKKENTISLNNSGTITSWEDFEKYKWPDANKCCYDALEKGGDCLHDGMKFIPSGPGGLFENVISLVGYDNLCFMMIDEPDLAEAIFEKVGNEFVKFYEICASFDTVGAILTNDDWAFGTSTMISPEQLRKYVFPYHKRMVEAAHKYNKPAILHSCGNMDEIWDDIIDYMKCDCKHSFEDKIMPIEEAYEKLHPKISVVGGIDMHFMATKTPAEIRERCIKLLEQVGDRGGYALGTGNSVPEYIPIENYVALLDVIRE